MKMISLATLVFTFTGLAACSVNSGNASRQTSWGKEGVSMLDYQTDGILCATLSERAQADSGTRTAGGLNGSNNSAAGAGASGSAGSQGGGTFGSPGVYRETASPDMVNRAANQNQSREMQLKQARMDALRSCLVGRGYTEFELTDAERAKLDSLPSGSDERRDYLYSLGTNSEILKTRAVTKPAAPAPAAGNATPSNQK